MTTVTRHTEYRASSHRTTSYHIPEDQVHWTGRKPDTPTPRRISPDDLPGVVQIDITRERIFFPQSLDVQRELNRDREEQEVVKRFFNSMPPKEERESQQQAEFYKRISESFGERDVMNVDTQQETHHSAQETHHHRSDTITRTNVVTQARLKKITRQFQEGQRQLELEKERTASLRLQKEAQKTQGCHCVIL